MVGIGSIFQHIFKLTSLLQPMFSEIRTENVGESGSGAKGSKIGGRAWFWFSHAHRLRGSERG